MHSFFSITASDVQKLNDEQAREFVAKLCQAQLRESGLLETGVEWGGDQRSADGGIDVYVNLGTGEQFSATYPYSKIQIQVKAEKFPPSKINKEMAPNDILRGCIGELALAGGAYIIVSTRDNCSHSRYGKRIAAMSQAAEALTSTGKLEFGFLDASRLAAWAGRYQDVILWVKAVIGDRRSGWQPFSNWSYRDDGSAPEYLVDKLPRVFDSQHKEDITVEEGIRRIRSILKARKHAVRLVGLSGVGKTRLLQALFDSAVASDESEIHASLAVYADLSDTLIPQPDVLAEELVFREKQTVLIVDNCSAALHEQLCTHCVGSDHVSLITIEYDIRDDAPENTHFFRLSGSSPELVADFLQMKKLGLSYQDIVAITEFSGGNLRIALALADTSTKSGELANLNNDVLFQRLFRQSYAENPDLLQDAKSLSLVYSFNTEISEEDSELALLAKLSGTPVNRLYASTVKLRRRGLLQRRGKWAAVLPPAIANRLAVEAIDSLSPHALEDAFFKTTNPRMSKSFARRLGYLHDSEAAVELAARLLSENGLLGNFHTLSYKKMEKFALIASTNQKAALDAVQRYVDAVDSGEAGLHLYKDAERLLGHLAYEKPMFNQACELLVRLRIHADRKSYDRKNNPDTLRTLFFARHSQTTASADQRREFLTDQLTSSLIDRQRIGFELLEASLETRNFRGSWKSDFGAHSRGRGVYVGDDVTVNEWFVPLIEILRESGLQSGTAGKTYRIVAANAFYGLVDDLRLLEACLRLAKDLKRIDGWPEGWCSCQKVLKYSDLNAEERDSVERLAEKLTPSNLNSEIRANLLSPNASILWLQEEDRGGARNRLGERIRELGRRAGTEETELLELVGELAMPGCENVHFFAEGVGETITNPKNLLVAAKLANQNKSQVSTRFFGCVLASWSKRVGDDVLGELLDWLVGDEFYMTQFVELQAWSRPDLGLYLRIKQLLAADEVPAMSYHLIWNSTFVDGMHSSQFTNVLTELRFKPKGDTAVAEILTMITHDPKKVPCQLAGPIREFAINFLKTLAQDSYDDNAPNIRDFFYLLNGEFLADLDEQTHFEIFGHLLELETNSSGYHGDTCVDLLCFFYRKYPVQTADRVFNWLRNNPNISTIHPDQFPFDSRAPLLEADGAELFEWMGSSYERFVFLAKGCPLIAGETKKQSVICPLLKKLVLVWPNKSQAVEQVLRKICPSGFSGSMSAELQLRASVAESIRHHLDAPATAILDAEIEKTRQWAVREEAAEERDRQESNERFE